VRAGHAVVRLVVVFQAAQQEGDAERQQQVGEDRADDRGAHHLELAGMQGPPAR
jgi:hypothetical protein